MSLFPTLRGFSQRIPLLQLRLLIVMTKEKESANTTKPSIYCTTAQEDNAILESFLRGAKAKKLDFNRIILMRTGANVSAYLPTYPSTHPTQFPLSSNSLLTPPQPTVRPPTPPRNNSPKLLPRHIRRLPPLHSKYLQRGH